MTKVLIVSTGRKTRGGITAVIKSYEKGLTWTQYRCHWVQTHRDGSYIIKLCYFFSGLIDYILRIPFYDIVHLHVSQLTTIKRKSVFLKIARLFKKKTIIHFHAYNIEDTIAGKYQKKYLKVFNESSMVVVLSGWWKKQLIEKLQIPSKKIRILYNPCPIVSKNNIDKYKVILYAGTVNERKGYKDLIKAFSLIADNYPDWKVVFAGNGEIEEGSALAKELKIENQIEFCGWVIGEEKENLFNAASIFCLPSYAEGFPMAVLDAWAYGLPVITTPVGGIPDVAQDGINMLLFNPGDTEKLAFNLKTMINSYEGDKILYNRIKEASKLFSYNEFSLSNLDRQLGMIYEELTYG